MLPLARRITAAALATLSGVACSAAVIGQESAEVVIVDEPARGFRMTVPEDWRVADTTEAGGSFALVLVPRSGEPLRATLRVNPMGSEGLAPEAVRQVSVNALAADPAYSGTLLIDRERAGGNVPALRFDHDGGPTPLRVIQAYLGHHGDAYLTQSLAPRSGFDSYEPDFDRLWSGLELLDPTPEQLEERRLRTLAARCGDEVDWATDWNEASRRARTLGRPVLAWVHRFGGFDLTDDAMVTAFSDPDIVSLLDHCFVPLRLSRDDAAPFDDHEVYGLGPSTFGQAALVVTPDGQVLSDCQQPLDAFLREAALEWAARHPSRVARPEGDTDEQARSALARGDFQEVRRLLERPASASQHRLLAAVHRRERETEGALDALDAAVQSPGADALMPDLDADRATLLVQAGRSEEALALAGAWSEQHAGHPRADELSYLQAVVLARRDGREAGEELLRAITLREPASRWSPIAAATLLSTAWRADRLGPSDAPRASDPYEQLRPARYAPLSASQLTRARDDARDWLLGRQREDGAWDSPYGLGGTGRPPSELELASVALAGTALFGQPDDVSRQAAERALDWCRKGDAWLRQDGEPPLYMDYAVWGRPALIELALAAGRAEPGWRDELAPEIDLWLAELQEQAKPLGGWSYYLSGTAEGAGSAPDVAMSFTTASAVLTLLAARDAGHAVDEAILAEALDALQACRIPGEGYAYWRDTDGGAMPIRGPAGAAGRGPVCARALWRGGRVGRDPVRESLERFEEHHEDVFAERGKSLMHTGAAAQGSHYLMFDLLHAALAVGEVDGAVSRRARRAVVEELLALRTADGSYVDNPILGRAPATAMALMAYESLLGDR